MAAIHQFVPTFEPGAVGGHVMEIRRVLRASGVESEIFAEHHRGPHKAQSIDFTEYGKGVRADADDVLIYHMAIGSVVGDFVRDRPERLVVDHHNITPAEYYEVWEPDVVHGIAWGRHQVAELSGRAVLGIADSAYNATELVDAGYKNTAVVPILVSPGDLGGVADPEVAERLHTAKQGGGVDMLFVGRLAPNKAQHDLIKALAAYRKLYDPLARLHLVGGSSADAYLEALGGFAQALGISQAVEITGPVRHGDLIAQYQAADVFVSASEHEGFCVPILEAWQHSLPVVAFSSSAVPETLGDAGVLLERKDPATFATAVGRVLGDEALRGELVSRGASRLESFSLAHTEAKFLAAIRPISGALR